MSQRKFVINWLENTRHHNGFEGHMEQVMNFNSLNAEELYYYYNEWISDEEKEEFFEDSKDVEELRSELVNYFVREFGDSEQEAKDSVGNVHYGDEIPIGFTVLGDGEVEFDAQAMLITKDLSIEREIVGGHDIVHKEYQYFSSIKDITNEVENMTLLDAVRPEKVSVEELTKMSREQDELVFKNVQEIIGNAEYGESPYLISERHGNFSRDVIVYGYDPESALDNFVEHGESEHDWESSEFDLEDFENPYMAKGYFPLEMNDIVIQDVEQAKVDKYLVNRDKDNPRDVKKDSSLER